MLVSELIKILKNKPQDAEVRFWNYAELREEDIEEENIKTIPCYSPSPSLIVLIE